MKWRLVTLIGMLFTAGGAADDPCKSGLQPGQRLGPYSFVLSTGDKRGCSHCYICDTGDNPGVAIFARSTSAALGKLVGDLDKAVSEDKTGKLRAWVTFLSDDQPGWDTKLVKWGKEHSIRRIPCGVFEDPAGPPSYRLARDAEVTVLFFVKQQVTANFAFRVGELTDARVGEVMKALRPILESK
jgi:hypothetical protein